MLLLHSFYISHANVQCYFFSQTIFISVTCYYITSVYYWCIFYLISFTVNLTHCTAFSFIKSMPP